MDDEKKIDTSGQHFEHAPNGEPAIHETDMFREGLSFRRVFHRPDNSKFFQEALDKYGEDGSIDPEAERRLVRKLDWTIIPVRRARFSSHPLPCVGLSVLLEAFC